MKKYAFCLVLLMGIFTLSSAQRKFAVDRGVILLDGQISFSNYGDEDSDNRTTNITINPMFGYFVIRHLVIGIELLESSTVQGDYSSNDIGVGPMVAFYFGRQKSRVFPFISTSLMMVFGSTDSGNSYYETKYTDSQFDINFAGGVTFMVAKNVGITGKGYFNLNSYKAEPDDEATTGNAFGFSIGVSTFIY